VRKTQRKACVVVSNSLHTGGLYVRSKGITLLEKDDVLNIKMNWKFHLSEIPGITPSVYTPCHLPGIRSILLSYLNLLGTETSLTN
jgi:hypothetical protein